MTDITPIVPEGRQLIQSYGNGRFRIAGTVYEGAVLVLPERTQALGAARDFKLPTLSVIFDNRKYAAMQNMHLKMYPDGAAVATDTFHGTHIDAPDFAKVAESVDGYGIRVDDPDALPDALRNGLAAVAEGRPAIVDVVCGY